MWGAVMPLPVCKSFHSPRGVYCLCISIVLPLAFGYKSFSVILAMGGRELHLYKISDDDVVWGGQAYFLESVETVLQVAREIAQKG